MPLESYDGETFVAFIDISGFKEIMKDENKAWRALDKFYNAGYQVLGIHRYDSYIIDGLFVSDNGVLYVKQENQNIQNKIQGLKKILKVVKDINLRMREEDVMLITSIAYGKFKYQARIEFDGIEKSPIYGNAYLSAFLDIENGKPKIHPGQCRIVKRNLPAGIMDVIMEENSDEVFRMVKARQGDKFHLYFYWMVESPDEIEDFEHRYTDTYKLKFEGMLNALKGE